MNRRKEDFFSALAAAAAYKLVDIGNSGLTLHRATNSSIHR